MTPIARRWETNSSVQARPDRPPVQLDGIRIADALERAGGLAGLLFIDFGVDVVTMEAPSAECYSAEWRTLDVS